MRGRGWRRPCDLHISAVLANARLLCHDLDLHGLVVNNDLGSDLWGDRRGRRGRLVCCRHRRGTSWSRPCRGTGLVIKSFRFCYLFTIKDRLEKCVFYNQGTYVSATFDGVLGPPRLVRHT